jgi:hypothetical protein
MGDGARPSKAVAEMAMRIMGALTASPKSADRTQNRSGRIRADRAGILGLRGAGPAHSDLPGLTLTLSKLFRDGLFRPGINDAGQAMGRLIAKPVPAWRS